MSDGVALCRVVKRCELRRQTQQGEEMSPGCENPATNAHSDTEKAHAASATEDDRELVAMESADGFHSKEAGSDPAPGPKSSSKSCLKGHIAFPKPTKRSGLGIAIPGRRITQ